MWYLAGSQAVDQPIQPLCAWVACSLPIQRLLASVSRVGGAALGLSHAALRSTVLGLWVEQLASAPDAHPPEVSGVGAPQGFRVWAPSSLICVHATGLQMSAWAAYPAFTVQWQSGEGLQGPRLLPRVL